MKCFMPSKMVLCTFRAIANAQYQTRSCFGPFRSYFYKAKHISIGALCNRENKKWGGAKVDRRGNTIRKGRQKRTTQIHAGLKWRMAFPHEYILQPIFVLKKLCFPVRGIFTVHRNKSVTMWDGIRTLVSLAGYVSKKRTCV